MYSLYYFPAKGRAQQIRLALAEADQDWVEEQCDFARFRSLKAENSFPYGQLPVLDVTDIEGSDSTVRLAQCPAIVEYIALRHGLISDDLIARQQALAHTLAAEDFRGLLYKVVFAGSDEAKARELENLQQNGGPRWLSTFSRLLEGKEYLLGQFSYCDLAVYDALTFAGDVLGASFLNDYPTIVSFIERVGSRPKVATFLASDKCPKQ
ncbi:hypothetical protein GEMRC1_007942 [Eukaryota sp. GEM-RC1]